MKESENKGLLQSIVEEVLPEEPGPEDIRNEIWEELSDIYYKYEYRDQKNAFREVMYEITSKINEGKWESIYQKLYRKKQKASHL